jgi:hypothetical protein
MSKAAWFLGGLILIAALSIVYGTSVLLTPERHAPPDSAANPFWLETISNLELVDDPDLHPYDAINWTVPYLIVPGLLLLLSAIALRWVGVWRTRSPGALS